MATGSTPIYNLPYPIYTDPVNVHTDMQALAEQVEDILDIKASLTLQNNFTNVNTFEASSYSPVVTITQGGAGDAFLVNDVSGGDATPFVINNIGNIAIGKDTADEKLEVIGNTNITGVLLLGEESRNDYLTLGTNVQTATFKEKSGGYATITTADPHGFSSSQLITIALDPADPLFDGEFEVYDAPTTTTIRYASIGTVFSTATAGSVSAVPGYRNPVGVITSDVDGYAQLALRNNSSGPDASTDVILYANNGTNEFGYIDIGITSSSFTDPLYTITGTNDGYIFVEAPVDTAGNGNLVLATGSTGVQNAIVFAAGGLLSNNTQMVIWPDQKVAIEIDTESTSASTGAFTVVGGAGITGSLSVDGLIRLTNRIYIGEGAEEYEADAGLINAGMVFELNGTPYAQMVIHNADSNSSSDYVAYADDGTEEAGYIDLGINSATFDQATYGITGGHDGYLFMEASTPNLRDLTFKAVSSGVATITTATSHGYAPGNIVIFTGLGTGLDGKKTLISASGTTLTYATTASDIGSTAVVDATVHKPTGNGNLVLATGANGLKNSIVFAAGGFSTGLTQMEIIPDQEVHIEIATPSTSPTTGALTIKGGLGVLGDVNVQGSVNIAGTITFGGSGTTVEAANLAVTDPAIFVGTDNQADLVDLAVYGEYAVTVSAITKSITNKALTSNVATLTTSVAHTYQVGDVVTITDVDSTFNGTFNIRTVPTTTTFTYDVTHANVTSVAVSPTGTSVVNARRRYYGIARDASDSGIVKFFKDGITKPSNTNDFSQVGLGYADIRVGAVTGTAGSLSSLSLTTPLPNTSGGTGFGTYSTGDILYASAANTLSKLGAGTAGYLLTMVGGIPQWAAAPITLPVQSTNAGKYLTTDGTNASWFALAGQYAQNAEPTGVGIVDGALWIDLDASLSAQDIDTLLPVQTGNAGKFLVTSGTASSWSNTAISTSSSAIALIAKGTTSQSVDIFEVQNTSSSVLFAVGSTGKVGIGTTSFSTLLTLSGTVSGSLEPAITLINTTASTGKTYQIISTDAGALSVYDSTGTATRLLINTSGNIVVGGTTASSRLHLIQESGSMIELLDTFSATSDGSYVIGRKARGTLTSPTATQSGDLLSAFVGRGYGTTAWTTNDVSSIKMYATENFTDSAQGTYISLFTTTALSTTPVERMRIDNVGKITFGPYSASTSKIDIQSEATALFVNHNTTTANGGYLRFQNNGTSIADIGTGASIISTAGSGSPSASDFGINARTGNVLLSTGQFERFRVDANGNSKFFSSILETATISATAANGTMTYDVMSNKNVLYYTTNASANFTLNFRGNASISLNTLMDIGQSLTIAFLVTNGTTAYYQNSQCQIDGTTSGVTQRWQGGTAPTTGNASSVDVYSHTIIKTANATYTVLSSITKF